MVKLKAESTSAEHWISALAASRGQDAVQPMIRALAVYEHADQHALLHGIQIADVLLELNLDAETLTAALLYPALQQGIIDGEKIAEDFGENTQKLLLDVTHMQSLRKMQQQEKQQPEQLRRMFLAMVSDVQAVLITLAERLCKLRLAKESGRDEQLRIARETLDIYAPLANRLGIWQIKWEMEDLCLRYLEPDVYSTLAKSLASRRVERERYLDDAIAILTTTFQHAGLKKFEIHGRVKHIYSIYSKMKRKNADFVNIYDISACRVLVSSIDDCFTVLGILQDNWEQVPEEFDDYISQPKPNGYRSIHTVILGPNNQYIEVQIRTHDMHQESELGVASHWRYKEGVVQASHYEAKLALLRQLMEWQKDIAGAGHAKTEKSLRDIFADNVYVFTPQGDIIELPVGSTPLDFAYHIHSEIGHRCRGAKVDGKMVPLTFQLVTGNRVEVITAKEASPSRDWLNPQYGYLKSPRAKSKLAHWFRVQDNLLQEVKPHEVDHKDQKKSKFFEREKIGTAVIQPKEIMPTLKPPENLGIDDLLTKLAACCKPLPGDEVIGYITQKSGVSIHRVDCTNIRHLREHNARRFIEVNFNKQYTSAYPVDLVISAYNRAGLLRDVTGMVAGENIHLAGLRTQEIPGAAEVYIYMTIIISSIDELHKAQGLIKGVPSVISVRRC